LEGDGGFPAEKWLRILTFLSFWGWGEKEWIIAYLWGVGLERCEEAEPFWVGGYGKKENC